MLQAYLLKHSYLITRVKKKKRGGSRYLFFFIPKMPEKKHFTLAYSVGNAYTGLRLLHVMTSADFSQQLRHLINSFLRYLVAGGAGFLIDYAVLALCYHIFGWHYLLASALGFLLGLVFVYVASNTWVFESRKLRRHRFAEFFLFAAIGLIGLLLTMAFMWLFVEKVFFPPLIAKLVTTALVLLWNFGARKFLLY